MSKKEDDRKARVTVPFFSDKPAKEMSDEELQERLTALQNQKRERVTAKRNTTYKKSIKGQLEGLPPEALAELKESLKRKMEEKVRETPEKKDA